MLGTRAGLLAAARQHRPAAARRRLPGLLAPGAANELELGAPHGSDFPYRGVRMYDIDGFDATASDVASLHAAGMGVICYLSVGSYENWRPDASSFPAAILGTNVDNWPGERWLDIRGIQQPDSALARIMNARLDMCKSKGFDAVELDNMDGYRHSTGFPLTAEQEAGTSCTWPTVPGSAGSRP